MQYSSVEVTSSQYYISKFSGLAEVNPNLFGNIYTGFTSTTYEQFKTASAPYQFNLVRWPGGTLAESKNYSLTDDNLLKTSPDGSGRNIKEIISDVNEHGMAMSMIIPTRIYMNPTASDYEKQELVRQGQRDLSQFLTKLYAGQYGKIPDDFTLEIGNESSWVGWQSGDYGKLANAFLSTFIKFEKAAKLSGNESEIKIAMQLGPHEAQEGIFNFVSYTNLREVDAFVRHSGLQSSVDGFTTPNGDHVTGYDLASETIKLKRVDRYWQDAFSQIGKAAPELTVIDTAWTVGPASASLTSSQLQDYDVGSRQGVSTIKLFSQMIASGSDAAAVWGTVGTNPNRFFWHEGVETITHGGEALRLMAESLVGTTLLKGKVDENDNWVESGKNFDTVFFEDSEKLVVFLTSGDIPAEGLAVSVSINDFHHVGLASVETIGTVNINSPLSEQRPSKPLTDVMLLNDDGSFTYEFTQDNQIARVIIYKDDTVAEKEISAISDPRDIIWGTTGDDRINGSDGRNFIFGGTGFDQVSWEESSAAINVDLFSGHVNISKHLTKIASIESLKGSEFADYILANDESNEIFGGGGADIIHGNSGDDTIFGGAGSDCITGASGSDWLNGGSGNDTIFGGSGDDTIFASSGLDNVDGKSGTDLFSYEGAAAVSFTLSDNIDSISVFQAADLDGAIISNLSSIEGVRFGSGNDRAVGNRFNNFFDGSAGNDTISGWNGNDTLYGGIGRDELYGGKGNDLLDGGAGNDYISGGKGSDKFIYSGGHDNFKDVNFSDGDYLDLVFVKETYGIGNFQDLRQHAVDSQGSLTIYFSDSDSLTLTGLMLKDLNLSESSVYF